MSKMISAGQLSHVNEWVRRLIARGYTPWRARRIASQAVARVFRRWPNMARGPLPVMRGRWGQVIRRRGLDGGLEGAVSSQADYNLLDQVQKKAVYLQSEISGIGKEEWDRALDSSAVVAAGWVPKSSYSYDAMMAFWLGNLKSIITTDKNPATMEQIAEVNRLWGGSQKLLDLVKANVSSEAAAKAVSDRAQTEAMLSKSKMLSPGDEGYKAFQEELEARAKSLVGGGVGIVTIAAIIAGILGVGIVASKL